MFYADRYITMGWEDKTWQNAQNAEKTLKPRKNLGRWLENQTRQERGHNSP
jgi:hypothetical protein